MPHHIIQDFGTPRESRSRGVSSRHFDNDRPRAYGFKVGSATLAPSEEPGFSGR